jgi:N-acyl amino acid synthase of PEP-CTERM/exosortase system
MSIKSSASEKKQQVATPQTKMGAQTSGKFSFPGSLSLRARRLDKEKDSLDYEALYRLRYQVYCHEAKFLKPEDYSDGLETDIYDETSEHFLATGGFRDDEVLGTVRLVRWSERLSFPTASFFASLIPELQCRNFPIDSTAEISRLCISKQFRKRALDGLYGTDGYLENRRDQRRKYPAIILELFKTMYLGSMELGITHWIATFEDCLHRLLSRYGVQMELLFPEEIEYYGKVRIYGASVSELEESIRERRPELYDYFTERDHT